MNIVCFGLPKACQNTIPSHAASIDNGNIVDMLSS
jgi:hypothetical protein